MLRWRAADYEGGRRVAISGQIEVGAVFPPHPDGGKWGWRLFVGGGSGAALSHIGVNGTAKTELAAKMAVDAEWTKFLAAAGLKDW